MEEGHFLLKEAGAMRPDCGDVLPGDVRLRRRRRVWDARGSRALLSCSSDWFASSVHERAITAPRWSALQLAFAAVLRGAPRTHSTAAIRPPGSYFSYRNATSSAGWARRKGSTACRGLDGRLLGVAAAVW